LAYTIEQFAAFESGSIPGIYHTSWASVVSTPAPKYSSQTYCLRLSNTSFANFIRWKGFTPGTKFWTAGGRFQVDTFSGDSTFMILVIESGASFTDSEYLGIDSGDLVLYNSAGTEVTRYAAGIVAGQWYNLGYKFDAVTGNKQVYFENKLVISSATSGPSGTTYVTFINDSNPVALINVFWDHYYLTSDTGSDITTNQDSFLGEVYAVGYRNSNGTVNDKWGTNPTSGTWANAQEVPFSTTNVAAWLSSDPGFTSGVTCSEGSQDGPLNDTRIINDSKFICGITLASVKYSSNFPPFPTLYLRYGQQSAGSGTIDNTTEQSVGTVNSTTYKNFYVLYTTFLAAYVNTKNHQHGLRADMTDITSKTVTVSDLYSNYLFQLLPFIHEAEGIKPMRGSIDVLAY
jgi:hypothetical protein